MSKALCKERKSALDLYTPGGAYAPSSAGCEWNRVIARCMRRALHPGMREEHRTAAPARRSCESAAPPRLAAAPAPDRRPGRRAACRQRSARARPCRAPAPAATARSPARWLSKPAGLTCTTARGRRCGTGCVRDATCPHRRRRGPEYRSGGNPAVSARAAARTAGVPRRRRLPAPPTWWRRASGHCARSSAGTWRRTQRRLAARCASRSWSAAPARPADCSPATSCPSCIRRQSPHARAARRRRQRARLSLRVATGTWCRSSWLIVSRSRLQAGQARQDVARVLRRRRSGSPAARCISGCGRSARAHGAPHFAHRRLP